MPKTITSVGFPKKTHGAASLVLARCVDSRFRWPLRSHPALLCLVGGSEEIGMFSSSNHQQN